MKNKKPADTIKPAFDWPMPSAESKSMIEKISNQKPMRTLGSLSDQELEGCFEGSSNVDLVRKLLEENLAPDGWVWDADFGHSFATAIQSFIGEDEDTPEWDKAWEINYEWGAKIADNVNELLSQPQS